MKETQGKQKKKRDRWKGRAGDPDNDDDDEQIMQRLKRLLVAMAARLGAAALNSPFLCFFLVFLYINSFFNCKVSWANPVCKSLTWYSLTIQCRPKYVPWEFTVVMVTVVYIAPNANANSALSQLYNVQLT